MPNFPQNIIWHGIERQYKLVCWSFHLHSIMSFLRRCSYRLYVAIRPFWYHAFNHDNICEYRQVVAQEIFTRENRLQTSFHLQLSTTDPLRFFEPSAINLDVVLSNVGSGKMIAHRLSGGAYIENKLKKIFKASKRILKANRDCTIKKWQTSCWRF